jgi:hypothetical protein
MNAEIRNPEAVKVESASRITILVNGRNVTMPDRIVSGAEIKRAAIEQSVLIQPSFVLIEELPNGTNKTIGDTDQVRIRQRSRFSAIAPDDNS